MSTQYVVTDEELIAVANAIRAKGGTSENLEWHSDFISSIQNISGGWSDKIYSLINPEYYISTQNKIIVNVNGRDYYKVNSDPAFMAYYCTGQFTGPILVSKTEDGCKYYYGYNNQIGGSKKTINGETWYVSESGAFYSGNRTKNSGDALKLDGTFSTTEAAAEALIALARGGEVGNINLLSGSEVPSSILGDNKSIYLQYEKATQASPEEPITAVFLKKNDSWVNLIGQDISDVNFGS